jgi:transposase
VNPASEKRVRQGTKYLFPRNRGTLRSDQQNRLEKDLKRLGDWRFPGAAWNFLAKRYRRAIDSQIEPLQRMARTPSTN